jgi:AraC-like DNA-binding protein/mannose-6-phosphate isomerase-like protein (cupin superfamily)
MRDGHELTEQKRGYLKGDFELFHLKDMKSMQFEYHYHDFNKIFIFISGDVTYLIEGRAYSLKPWDILFVNNREIHKPIIDPDTLYERIVIYVNPDFLEKHSDECSLFTCFDLANERNSNLLRLDGVRLKDLKQILAKLEEAIRSKGFGSHILKNSIFLQLLVTLSRELLGTESSAETSDIVSDEAIQLILDYINANISSDLSIDTLASIFFTSRYHLMHKFKLQTGYSVHSYILQKRLIKADHLVKSGRPIAQAAEESGFYDYSSFVRAFKKMFGQSPKNRSKSLL